MIPQAERFYNPDSQWGVYWFTTNDMIPYYSDCFDEQMQPCKGSALAGNMQQLTIGVAYHVTAIAEYNQKFKQHQYVPQIVKAIQPVSQTAQAAYLRTQVTPKQAENILALYPNVVQDILDNKDIDYNAIKGIGKKTWDKICENVIKNYGVADIITLLQPLGVTYNMINKLIQHYPTPEIAKQELQRNPYILTRIHGLGWQRVDDIALKLYPQFRESDIRTLAFLKYYLRGLGENEGHTYMRLDALNEEVNTHIPECYEVYQSIIEKQKHNGLFLHFEDDLIGLQEYYDTEYEVVNILKHLNSINSYFSIDFEAGRQRAENAQSFKFTDEQIECLKQCCQGNVVLISGGAGVGKSTILRGIVNIYQKYSIACCALSAKAAQRIKEATGHDAMTIHRLLGYDGRKFKFDVNAKLPYNVLIIDEASMINTSLFYHLLCAVNEGTKVIVCGDDGQLPPIGYGNSFHDLLNLDLFNSCKLTKIMRQAAKSGVIVDAWQIRNNKNPLQRYEHKIVRGELGDMTYMFRTNREAMRDLAINLFFKSIENGSVEDTVIITPCKQNRVNCTQEINNIILDRLIPDDGKLSARYGQKVFRVGTRVMQIVNDYKNNVYNGEMGYVDKIYHAHDNNGKYLCIDIAFGDDGQKVVSYKQSELCNIELAYCLTVHKMQGSGVKNVIVLIDNTHFKLLDSCLLYTGLTRTIKKCLLIAEPNAFERCIKTKASKRRTWLSLEYKENKY